jgi:fatty acid desaturase
LKDLEVGPLLSEPNNLHPSSKSQPDAELENVREQLVAEGCFEASRLYYARKVLEIVLFWATAALLLFHGQVVLASVSMALMWQQGGWMSHDFAHNCFFRRNRKANARMLLLTGAITIGFSPEWWKGKHNYHHAVPNEVDNVGNPVDPDIDTLPVLAWDSSIASHSLSAFKPALRHQQFLLAPALAVARASWLTQSLLKAVHDARAKDGSINELLCLCGHHLSTFAFAAVLAPAPAAAVTFYLAAQCIGGIVLGSAFVVSHNGKEVHTGKEGFVAEQVATTRNVNRGAFNNWFMGALNMQVEHHLFPTLPRHSLPRAAELVKQLCNRNGLLYEDVGLLEAFGLVHKHLKAVAKAI